MVERYQADLLIALRDCTAELALLRQAMEHNTAAVTRLARQERHMDQDVQALTQAMDEAESAEQALKAGLDALVAVLASATIDPADRQAIEAVVTRMQSHVASLQGDTTEATDAVNPPPPAQG
jgi:hypothetical protein